MTRQARPDFLIIGAPKAGTTALHAALAEHPGVFMSVPKEPKYWLCDDAPPPAWHGPGDAHSQQEWIWRREDYEAIFAAAPAGLLRGESTPFYLWSRGAHHRIAEALDEVRLVVVVRDPIDRAYSNWMHLWSDGLEPEADFVAAFHRQEERVAAGWAPFWRYRDLGLYGEQLRHLYRYVDRERVLVLRYRDVIDAPAASVDRTCRFLGLDEGLVTEIPRDNSRPYVAPGWRSRTIAPTIRLGARLGAYVPPEVWRAASVPMVRLLAGPARHDRPRLTPLQRRQLLPAFAEDVELLSAITGEDFGDWLTTASRGSFTQRLAARQAAVGGQPDSTP